MQVQLYIMFFPFYTFSDCLIWPPLSFFILCFLPFHPPVLPPPPIFSSCSFHSILIQTYWVRMLSSQQNNEASLSSSPSPVLLTIFIICSYIVCLPVCLPVSFSVPHTSVRQPGSLEQKELQSGKRSVGGRLVSALNCERE